MCVRECPSDTGDVKCFQPSFVFVQSDYYDGCVFYVGGVDYGVPFRYATELRGGKFCVPKLDALGPAMEELVTNFKV